MVHSGQLHDPVVMALAEVFTKYSVSGRMHREEAAKVFEIATETEKISPNDSRI